LLDLAIRDSTDNAKSLDNVMRSLGDRYSGAHGFTRDDLIATVRKVTGRDFEEFWRRYVSGVEEIPWNEYLRAAGWEVSFTEEPAVDGRIGSIPPAVQGGRWRAVAMPGSAAAAAGLRTGDELVRINGRPIIDATDVTAVVRTIGRGANVVVNVVRDSLPVTIRFQAGTYQRVRARLRDLSVQTDRMRRIRAGIVR
jgi:predicted metalloprotease with PDZ domain